MRKTFTLTILSILLSSTFILFSSQVNGQQTKQSLNFCRVKVYTTYKSNTVEMDYGNRGVSSKIIDNVPVDTSLDKVNLLKNDILILDYMNNLGWECFNIISTTSEHQFGEIVIYYFRKPKTE